MGLIPSVRLVRTFSGYSCFNRIGAADPDTSEITRRTPLDYSECALPIALAGIFAKIVGSGISFNINLP